MGRSNEEFKGGFEGFTEAYHVSPKYTRESIETHGLDPSRSGTHSFSDGRWLRGVFGHVHKEDVDPIYATGWQGRNINEGGDVYRYRLPKQGNQWDENSGLDSVRTSRKIPPRHIERVGHITLAGELHWHKEEECPNGQK